jgi:hypothetical protein
MKSGAAWACDSPINIRTTDTARDVNQNTLKNSYKYNEQEKCYETHHYVFAIAAWQKFNRLQRRTQFCLSGNANQNLSCDLDNRLGSGFYPD